MLKQQLIQARKAKKVTQVQMAKHLGMARSGYAKFELAGKSVSFDQIDTICHVLGVRVVLISESEFEAENGLELTPEFWDDFKVVLSNFYERHYRRVGESPKKSK